MNIRNTHRVCILMLLMGFGLTGIAVCRGEDAQEMCKRASALLEKGNCLGAFELYAKASVASGDQAQAEAGLRKARLQLQEKMGEISAGRVNELLTRLDQIDQSRIRDLTRQVVELEKAARKSSLEVAGLQEQLAFAHKSAVAGNEAAPDDKVVKLQAEITRLKQARVDTDARVATLESKIADVEREKAESQLAGQEQLKKAQLEVADLGKQKNTVAEQLERTARDLDKLRQDNQALAADVKRADQAVKDQTVVSAGQMEKLKADLASLENEKKELAVKVQELSVATAVPEKSQVKPDDKALQELKEANLQLANEIAGTRTALTVAETEKRELLAKIQQMAKAKGQPAAVASVTDNRVDLSADVAAQAEQIGELSRSAAQMQERCLAMVAKAEAKSPVASSRDVGNEVDGKLAELQAGLARMERHTTSRKVDLPMTPVPAITPAPVATTPAVSPQLSRELDEQTEHIVALAKDAEMLDRKSNQIGQGLQDSAKPLVDISTGIGEIGRSEAVASRRLKDFTKKLAGLEAKLESGRKIK